MFSYLVAAVVAIVYWQQEVPGTLRATNEELRRELVSRSSWPRSWSAIPKSLMLWGILAFALVGYVFAAEGLESALPLATLLGAIFAFAALELFADRVVLRLDQARLRAIQVSRITVRAATFGALILAWRYL